MHRKLIITLLIALLFSSCQDRKDITSEILEPQINPEKILSDFKSWWSYHYYYINLSSDFTGLNNRSDTLSKEMFLKQLESGSFVPIRVKSGHDKETYKLYEINATEFKSIAETIKDESLTTQFYLGMEGKTFPDFDFSDLKNNRYNNGLTKGKILVLKTWFIGCTACIKEFPELNTLVEEYSRNEDVLFISLALNSKTDLEKFLSEKPFNYKVVPDQKELIESALSLSAYPTHLVIDESGKIVKVVNRASEMISFLRDYMPPELPPPPPPS